MASFPSLRALLLLLAIASAIACEVSQQSTRSGSAAGSITAPSSLKRTIDDVPANSTSGIETTGCPTPPCTPPNPEPKPQPVMGQFVVFSADQSSLQQAYRTITQPSGVPVPRFIGNIDGNVVGTGRFTDARIAQFTVDFGNEGSATTVSLKWSIPNGAGVYKSYGDSTTVPYSSEKVADASCASGYRFKAVMSGQLEQLGRFTATLDHCVSVIQ